MNSQPISAEDLADAERWIVLFKKQDLPTPGDDPEHDEDFYEHWHGPLVHAQRLLPALLDEVHRLRAEMRHGVCSVCQGSGACCRRCC